MDVWDLEDPTPDAICCQQIDDRWVKASKLCLSAVFLIAGCKHQIQGKQRQNWKDRKPQM